MSNLKMFIYIGNFMSTVQVKILKWLKMVFLVPNQPQNTALNF